MSNHLNNTLPIEVLKKKSIFQTLIGKRRTCHYYTREYWKEFFAEKSKIHIKTCKSWQVATQEFFSEMSIRVSEDSLQRLSKDIVFFGHKFKSIRLVRIRRRYDVNGTAVCLVDRTLACLIWLDIILACPNLISMKIRTTDDFNYLHYLMDTTTTTERLAHN